MADIKPTSSPENGTYEVNTVLTKCHTDSMTFSDSHTTQILKQYDPMWCCREINHILKECNVYREFRDTTSLS